MKKSDENKVYLFGIVFILGALLFSVSSIADDISLLMMAQDKVCISSEHIKCKAHEFKMKNKVDLILKKVDLKHKNKPFKYKREYVKLPLDLKHSKYKRDYVRPISVSKHKYPH
jgi:hypothetical protein